MTTRFKKNLVLATAIISPLLMSAPAMANSASHPGSPQAINLLTTSVKESLSAYDHLNRGDVTMAQRKLDQALRSMQSAASKDPTLSLSQTPVTSLQNELKAVRMKLNSSDSFSARTELASVLSNAGIVLNS